MWIRGLLRVWSASARAKTLQTFVSGPNHFECQSQANSRHPVVACESLTHPYAVCLYEYQQVDCLDSDMCAMFQRLLLARVLYFTKLLCCVMTGECKQTLFVAATLECAPRRAEGTMIGRIVIHSLQQNITLRLDGLNLKSNNDFVVLSSSEAPTVQSHCSVYSVHQKSDAHRSAGVVTLMMTPR